MIPITIIPDVESRTIHPHVDLAGWQQWQRDSGESARVGAIGLLRHGTVEGRAAVLVRIDLPDGSYVIAETTWRLIKTAVRALGATPIASEEVDGP